MDPSLIRQREAFKARALATPAVEKRKKDVEIEKPAKKTKISEKNHNH